MCYKGFGEMTWVRKYLIIISIYCVFLIFSIILFEKETVTYFNSDFYLGDKNGVKNSEISSEIF